MNLFMVQTLTLILREMTNLPPNRHLVKLWGIASIINWRAYKQQEWLFKWDTPVLRVGNLFTNKNWYYSNLILDHDKYCQEWDLLFAWSASFWPFIRWWEKSIYHYHIRKVICNQWLKKEYLYRFLKSETVKMQSKWHGVWMIHRTKWFTIDGERLKNGRYFWKDYFAELLERVENRTERVI